MAATVGWLAVTLPALAFFAEAENVGANAFSTATLAAPSGLVADASCDGTNKAKSVLTWTATGSTFADGYDILRGMQNGGPYNEVGHVDGRTTTTYNDTNLSVNTTYYWVVRATASQWESASSNQDSERTPALCL